MGSTCVRPLQAYANSAELTQWVTKDTNYDLYVLVASELITNGASTLQITKINMQKIVIRC